MILIGFIHGIGDFSETDKDKVEILNVMQAEADKVYGPGKSKVIYLSYESLLDELRSSKITGFLAGMAGLFATAVPQSGSVPADYLRDIVQYYTSKKLRVKVDEHIRDQITRALMSYKPDGVILIGHSLGSVVLANMVSRIVPKATAHVVLIGSPIFSQIGLFKQLTRRMALDRGIRVPENTVNLWSRLDKVGGEAKTLGIVDIESKARHTALEAPFHTLLDYLHTLSVKSTEETA